MLNSGMTILMISNEHAISDRQIRFTNRLIFKSADKISAFSEGNQHYLYIQDSQHILC